MEVEREFEYVNICVCGLISVHLTIFSNWRYSFASDFPCSSHILSLVSLCPVLLGWQMSLLPDTMRTLTNQ